MVCDDDGRPLIMLLSEGQMSDHRGARLVLDACPKPIASSPTAPGSAKSSSPGVSSPASRPLKAGRNHRYDKPLYRRRHKVENLFVMATFLIRESDVLNITSLP
ncbi:IS5 family insertion sequence transposase domain-containing protein (plasmid) [Rhizobium gallicum]|uniref:IS5 family insertion sequence transposase domain-containing protein n=1 Tax=Rhizobium gallicum TaxID=56730 RepID=A0A1L5NR09_9HYPH|nr:IS5 family insertion sequence transposase domain-containing protein [Rhizobium gallicum]